MLLVEICDKCDNFSKFYINDVNYLGKAVKRFVELVLEGRLDNSIPIGCLEISVEEVEVVE